MTKYSQQLINAQTCTEWEMRTITVILDTLSGLDINDESLTNMQCAYNLLYI